MKNLQIMSDLHLDASRMQINVQNSDIVLILGDTTFEDENWYWLFDRLEGKPTIIIPGNHEYDGHDIATRDKEIKAIAEQYKNIYYLNNESVIVEGIKFIGTCLWTDFKADEPYLSQSSSMQLARDIGHLKTIKNNGRALTIEDIVQLNEKSIQFLEFELLKNRVPEPTVVLTHFAPSSLSISKEYAHTNNSYHIVKLDRLMGFSDYWLHGHVHCSQNYTIESTNVIANARGYSKFYDQAQNNFFNSQLSIQIQEYAKQPKFNR